MWDAAASGEQQFFVPGPRAIDSADQAVELAKYLFGQWLGERARLEVIRDWLQGRQPQVRATKSTPEYKLLVDLAQAPWADLVCSVFAQALQVNGFKDPDTGSVVEGAWETWQRNNMESRQTPLNRAVVGYGYAYTYVSAGVDADGPRSVIKGLSPLNAYAVYEDPANDEWPVYGLKIEPLSDQVRRVFLFDDTFKHELLYNPNETEPNKSWRYVGRLPHGAGVVPLVRYCNQLDLDGNTPGEVEPVLNILACLDKTAFDALMIQHFNSWKKYVASGLAGVSEQIAEQMASEVAVRVRQNDVIVVPDGVEIKALPETSMGDLLRAQESLITKLAQVKQIPSYLLTGNLVNVNADTLEAQRQSFTQKILERQASLGASHVQTLRLAARLQGDVAAAQDTNSRVTWQDFSVRSMAQAADALGKYAQMLGIPKQALWYDVPGKTRADVDGWIKLAEEQSSDVGAVEAFVQANVDGVPVRDANAAGDVNADNE